MNKLSRKTKESKEGIVNIRPYTEDDKEAVIDILTDALEFLMEGDYGLPKEVHRNFLIESGIVPPKPTPAYFVADFGGKTAGYMYIRWNGLEKTHKKGFSWLLSYGFPAFLRLSAEFAPDESDNIPDGACYISELAVKEEYRNKGIGTALIAYGRKLAKKAGFVKYTLDVYKTNPDAMRLYKRCGFEVTGEHRRNFVRRHLLGERNWYSMSQDL